MSEKTVGMLIVGGPCRNCDGTGKQQWTSRLPDPPQTEHVATPLLAGPVVVAGPAAMLALAKALKC